MILGATGLDWVAFGACVYEEAGLCGGWAGTQSLEKKWLPHGCFAPFSPCC